MAPSLVDRFHDLGLDDLDDDLELIDLKHDFGFSLFFASHLLLLSISIFTCNIVVDIYNFF